MSQTCPHCYSNDVSECDLEKIIKCQQCGFILCDVHLTFNEQPSVAAANQANHQLMYRGSGSSGYSSVPHAARMPSRSRGESYEALHNLASKLGIGRKYLESMKALLHNSMAKHWKRARSGQLLAAVVVYTVARQESLPLTLLDIAKVVNCDVFKLGRIYRRIERLSSDVRCERVLEPMLLLERDCSRLAIPDASRRAVLRHATTISNMMQRDWINTGRQPAASAAAALRISLEVNNISMPLKELCKSLDCSEYTVDQRYKEAMQRLLEMGQQLLPYGNVIKRRNLKAYVPQILTQIELRFQQQEPLLPQEPASMQPNQHSISSSSAPELHHADHHQDHGDGGVDDDDDDEDDDLDDEEVWISKNVSSIILARQGTTTSPTTTTTTTTTTTSISPTNTNATFLSAELEAAVANRAHSAPSMVISTAMPRSFIAGRKRSERRLQRMLCMKWRIWNTVSKCAPDQAALVASAIPEPLRCKPPPCVPDKPHDDAANLQLAFETSDDEDHKIMQALLNGVPEPAILLGYYTAADHRCNRSPYSGNNDTELSELDLNEHEMHLYFQTTAPPTVSASDPFSLFDADLSSSTESCDPLRDSYTSMDSNTSSSSFSSASPYPTTPAATPPPPLPVHAQALMLDLSVDSPPDRHSTELAVGQKRLRTSLGDRFSHIVPPASKRRLVASSDTTLHT